MGRPAGTVGPGGGGAGGPDVPRVGGWAPSGSGVLLCPPDTVKFGEVALQPPELTAQPRKSGSAGQVRGAGCPVPRGGRFSRGLAAVGPGFVTSPLLTPCPLLSGPQPGKKSLMLARLLGPGGVARPPPASMARQRILAEERARAVQAYRAVKAQRQAQGPPSAHLPPKKKPETRL